MPVLETDTGGRGEDPKVSGITLVKELGKIAPYVCKKGCLSKVKSLKGPQRSGSGDCLPKTQVSAKA